MWTPPSSFGRALVVALALSGCVHAPPTPDAQLVDNLTLHGTKHLDEGDIKKRILTTESSFWPIWMPWLGRASWFDPSAWQADLRRITRLYEANGYYQARITEDHVTETKKGHVKLLVRVQEGEPARVVTLEVIGLEQVDPAHAQEVLADVPLKVGAIFLEDDWVTTKQLIAAGLRERGYAEVVVTGEALVESDAARASLTLEVAAGRRYRFGKVFVATDPGAVVPPRLIADTVSPDVKPGDWFSESALAEAQARVFQMGVFGAVKVNRGAPDTEGGTVPVVIDVREAPFRGLRYGFGLGLDPIRSEIRLTAEYTDRNFGLTRLFDRKRLLDRLTLRAKVGVAVLPNALDLLLNQRPVQKWGPTGLVGIEYEAPRLFGLRSLSLKSSLDLNSVLDNAFDYLGGEARLGVLWRPRTDVTVFPSLNVGTYALNTEIPETSSGPTAALGCPTLPALCVVAWADVQVEWDRRDNRLEPRHGTYAAVSVQTGLSQTDGVRPYLRLEPEVRGYASFGSESQLTVAGKLRAGTLVAANDNAPVVARFFSGGGAMRGFNQRRLSPMVEVAETNAAGDTTYRALPVGGNSLVEASVELRWAFLENWVLAVFDDVGLVTSKPLGPSVDFARALYMAVGVGIRYRTPLGPVRVDLALRVPGFGGPQDVASPGGSTLVPAQPGCFGLGNVGAGYAGSPEDLCTFHLSIGEAF